MNTQHSMGLRIKKLREEKEMSQTTLAELVGYKDKTSIAKIEAGKVDLPQSKIYAFAKALNTTISYLFSDEINKTDYLLGLQENKDIVHSYQLKSSEFEHIKKYRDLDDHGKRIVDFILQEELERSITIQKQKNNIDTSFTKRIISYYYKNASAGSGQIIIDNLPEKDIEIPDLSEYKNVSYAIGVNGSSMEPTYYDGDILLVESTREIALGEIGIFQINGECFVKKLGETELISLNKAYPNIALNESAATLGRVIGKL